MNKRLIATLLAINLVANVIMRLLDAWAQPPIAGLVLITLMTVDAMFVPKAAKSDFKKRYGESHYRGRAARKLGYLWVFGLLLLLLVAPPEGQGWWITLLQAFCSGLLIWGTFRFAQRLDATDRVTTSYR